MVVRKNPPPSSDVPKIDRPTSPNQHAAIYLGADRSSPERCVERSSALSLVTGGTAPHQLGSFAFILPPSSNLTGNNNNNNNNQRIVAAPERRLRRRKEGAHEKGKERNEVGPRYQEEDARIVYRSTKTEMMDSRYLIRRIKRLNVKWDVFGFIGVAVIAVDLRGG